jgi:hypothetical protein
MKKGQTLYLALRVLGFVGYACPIFISIIYMGKFHKMSLAFILFM